MFFRQFSLGLFLFECLRLLYTSKENEKKISALAFSEFSLGRSILECFHPTAKGNEEKIVINSPTS